MFKIGDVCRVPSTKSNFDTIHIFGITLQYYDYTTNIGITRRCHINSIMANRFQLIASNVASIEEAKQLYPEFFV